MVEIGFFVKYANLTTIATIGLKPAILITGITLLFQLFLRK